MSLDDRSTIFALSSGRPPAAIAVVRISGPRAADGLRALAPKLPEPRRVGLRRLRDASGAVLDEALVLWLPGPNTETGEDMVELHLHGGRAVVAAVLAELGKVAGLRGAEPGEFTRRAFENGRLDLTAVEGLADLIFAETEAQRAQAMRQLQGMLGDKAETWRRRLVEALALVEARIDFSDEADVPEDLLGPALHIARQLSDEIEETLRDDRRGERLRDGLVVAIAGPPNAGKSSLLNRLARREAAIVSPYAGTTRDVIEVHLDLNGFPVTLLDTAGIRESDDPVEQEGVRRAQARAAAADLVLWVTEVGEDALGSAGKVDASAATRARLPTPVAQELSTRNESRVSTRLSKQWIVRNKIDLAKSLRNSPLTADSAQDRAFEISATKGFGVDGLIAALTTFADEMLRGSEPALISRQRHRQMLVETAAALARAVAETREEVVAEELRLAARALGRLTGRVDVEDVLDVIFRDFCIGK